MLRALIGGAIGLVLFTGDVLADYTVSIQGTEYPLGQLMVNCGRAAGGAEAQLKCFNALTQLVQEQSGESADVGNPSVSQALDSLRSLAQYRDAESSLSIAGNDCRIRILYYDNYFHISRRNVSTIDLFSTQFDASRLQLEQTTQVQGATMSWSKGLMVLGETAVSQGGSGLDSKQLSFPSKGPNASIEDYANSVLGILPVRQDQTFDFVLVHPERSNKSREIWQAFEAFVNACRATS